MFTSARIKLTLWYLLILMLISLLFSGIIYRVQVGEVQRILERQRVRIERGVLIVPPGGAIGVDTEILADAKSSLIRNLMLMNLGVLVLAGWAAYFLAGRTLSPIEEMVENQKRFITDASHELRTPLATMKTELEVGIRDRGLSKAAKDILKSNLEEVNRLSYLSERLLHLNNFEQNEEWVLEKISLVAILEQVMEKFQKPAVLKNIRLQPQLTELSVYGLEESLKEAFGTIIDNAIKYSPKDSQVNIEVRKQQSKAVIRIQDFGMGIKASDLPFIFRRFYRADQSRSKEKTAGFGLGLAIAKSIIEKHHGQIEVKSTPSKSTTFVISLPLAT